MQFIKLQAKMVHFFTAPNILVRTQFNKEHEHSRLQLNVYEEYGNK